MTLNKVPVKTQRGFGTSDTSTLEEMFPANPMPNYEPTPLMQDVLDGTTQGNDDYGPVNMDYDASPTLSDPENNEGAPFVDDPFAFQPNLSAPGPGSINPADKPAPPKSQPLAPSGMGSTTAPADTAASISKQKIGELIFGSSKGA